MSKPIIDFNKHFKNTDKWRGPAIHFGEHGYYTDAKPGSKEYIDYWSTEADRCLNGFKAKDGEYISGFHYFYLNYCPIKRMIYEEVKDRKTGKKRIVGSKVFGFPRFFDYDYYFFQYVEACIDQGKFGAVAKARDRGYSYKISSMCCRNYFLVEASSSYIYVGDERYLKGNGTMSKVYAVMDFIDDNTAWSKSRLIDNSHHRKSGYKVKNKAGKVVDAGFLSEVIGMTLRNNPDGARGVRGSLIFFEEAGSFPRLIESWQVAIPSIVHDGYVSGFMCAIGTGSTDNTDVEGLKDLFYNNEQHNVLGIPNIWDEGQSDTTCGFFCPQYANSEAVDKTTGKSIFMDDDGNTLTELALKHELDERKIKLEGVTNSTVVDLWVIEHAICPMESFQEIGENIFSKKPLQDQLSRLRVNKQLKYFKQVGDLREHDGEMVWEQKKHGDITRYPIAIEDDPKGSIVIWEHPKPMLPFGTYIAGLDSYDLDQGSSLGSIFIYKRYVEGEDFRDAIVAEYTGRPRTADEFYENVRRLLIYYNARCMYENQNKGVRTYLMNKKCDYLLAEQPDILQDIIRRSTVERGKGTHMTVEIKKFGLLAFRDWLLKEYSPGHPNSEHVFSEPLLQECLMFNGLGPKSRNVDRVSAMIVLMIYLKDVERRMLQPYQYSEARRRMFDYTFFASNSDPLGTNDVLEVPENNNVYNAGGTFITDLSPRNAV
jgi:hypothetical protein